MLESAGELSMSANIFTEWEEAGVGEVKKW